MLVENRRKSFIPEERGVIKKADFFKIPSPVVRDEHN